MHKAERVRRIFEILREGDPAPTTELHYATPFQLLVAVVLSAQATDKGVNKATPALFAAAPTPAAMAALGAEGVLPFVKSINFCNAKARNVAALAALLVERHGGEVPLDRAALEALPGVGRKTANVVLNTLEGAPVIAVDTHVFRVASRLGLAKADTPLEMEPKLTKAVPLEFRQNAHHWLILHGRYVCVARAPKCGECVLRGLCPFGSKVF